MRVIDFAAKQWLRRVLLGAIVVGFLLLGVGAVFESFATLAFGSLLLAFPFVWATKSVFELYRNVRELYRDAQVESGRSKRFAEDIESRLTALAAGFDELQTTLRGEVESLNARVKALSLRANETSEQLRLGSEALSSLNESHSDLTKKIERVLDRIRVLELDRTTLKNQRRQLSQSLSVLQASFGHLESRATASLDLLMGSANQGLSRLLSADQKGELVGHWLDRLGLSLSDEAIYYIERRVLLVEQMSDGRLAAATADAVFRVLAALSIDRDSVEVLEIGTLFGVNAVLFWDMLGASGSRAVQTLVDLFEGYYGEDTPDQYTGLVVSEGIVENNLRRAGATPEDFRLIRGNSHHQEIVDRVSDRQYDLVLIDGDHSYRGVTGDFERFWPLVRPGGFLLIDDYGSPSWSSVTKFVDELSDDDNFEEEVELFARTALIQRSNT